MAFQPFGYPFDIRSPLSSDDLREAIRARTVAWFDTTNGARGWVVGPLVCLWFSAFDRRGPMLLGWISRETWGTRIAGRAGSDLNGLLLLVALTPFMVFIVLTMASTDDGRLPERAALVGGIFAVIWVMVLWSKHAFRREAEPLVRFLRDAAGPSSPSRRADAAARVRFPGLVLTVSGEVHEGDVTPAMISDALLGIGPDGFAVLASAPETYLQTAWRDGGFIIEKRDGDQSRHFRAARPGRPVGLKDTSRLTFTYEEVLAVFLAYASARPTPASVAWEKMR